MPRHYSKLNVLAVQRAKSPGLFGDGAGLYLRVSRSGKKTWVFRFMLNGRARDMGLGPYPLRSLAEARELALNARKLLLDGRDPIEARKAAKRAEARATVKAITFDECAKACIESRRARWRNAKHAAQWETTIAKYVSPVFGKLAVRDVDTGLVMKALEPIWKRVPETVVRVRNRIEQILNWATVREYREGDNPARWKGHLDNLLEPPSKMKDDKMRAHKKTNRHFAALPFTQISDFMLHLRSEPGIAPLALEFTILTAARSGEVRGARWEEIDFESKTWTIPAERMKANKEHKVPLSSRAIKILERLRSESAAGLVFHGRTVGEALSNMSLTAVLRRMKCNVTTHGFRSTFRDWASERTAFPGEVAEAALAHVLKSKTERAYRREDFFEKRRKLMEAWASYCSRPAEKGNVVAINAAAAGN